MRHVAELVGATSAEVYGTATFYEMFRFEPIGKYLINICGTMSCALLGADELMHHAEHTLGVKAGSHHRRRSLHARARRVPGGLHRGADAAGELPPPLPGHHGGVRPARRRPARRSLDSEIPPHGTLGRDRQQIPAERWVGAPDPDDVTEGPAWIQVSPA